MIKTPRFLLMMAPLENIKQAKVKKGRCSHKKILFTKKKTEHDKTEKMQI